MQCPGCLFVHTCVCACVHTFLHSCIMSVCVCCYHVFMFISLTVFVSFHICAVHIWCMYLFVFHSNLCVCVYITVVFCKYVCVIHEIRRKSSRLQWILFGCFQVFYSNYALGIKRSLSWNCADVQLYVLKSGRCEMHFPAEILWNLVFWRNVKHLEIILITDWTFFFISSPQGKQ